MTDRDKTIRVLAALVRATVAFDRTAFTYADDITSRLGIGEDDDTDGVEAALRKVLMPPAARETGTARIRWEETPVGFINGYVGTLDPQAFEIWKPPQASGEWVLTAELPGTESVRFYGDDPEELKPEAERLLSRFVTSLGASFPESGHSSAHTLTVNLSGTDEAVTDSTALMSALEDYADRKRDEAQYDDSQSKFARSAERLRAAVEAAAEGRAGQ